MRRPARGPPSCSVVSFAVHPDLVQPVAAGDEPVRAGWQVPDPLHPLHPDRGGIERDQVGEVPGRDAAPAGDPEDRGRVPGDPPDGLLQGQRAGLPDPVLQQVGGEDRVAELAGVRARVGQAQQGAVVAQQPGQRFGVVVGDHDPEAGREVIVERDVAQHVERVDAALGGQLRERGAVGQLGVRHRLLHEYLVPAVVPLPGHVRPGPVAPGWVAVEPGAFGGGHGQHLRERVGAGERGRLGQGDLEDDRAAGDLGPYLAAAGRGLVQQAEGARRGVQGRPGDRPSGLDGKFGELHGAEVRSVRDRERAAAALGQRLGEPHQLVHGGEPAGHGLAPGPGVGGLAGGCEADRAGVEGFPDEPPHLLDLGLAWRPVRPPPRPARTAAAGCGRA